MMSWGLVYTSPIASFLRPPFHTFPRCPHPSTPPTSTPSALPLHMISRTPPSLPLSASIYHPPFHTFPRCPHPFTPPTSTPLALRLHMISRTSPSLSPPLQLTLHAHSPPPVVFSSPSSFPRLPGKLFSFSLHIFIPHKRSVERYSCLHQFVLSLFFFSFGLHSCRSCSVS